MGPENQESYDKVGWPRVSVCLLRAGSFLFYNLESKPSLFNIFQPAKSLKHRFWLYDAEMPLVTRI